MNQEPLPWGRARIDGSGSPMPDVLDPFANVEVFEGTKPRMKTKSALSYFGSDSEVAAVVGTVIYDDLGRG